MRVVATALAGLTGWRRATAAFVAGALSVLALAPFHFWFVLFLTIPVWVWLIDGGCAGTQGAALRARTAALTGWFFGLGYFLAGLYWVGASFLVEADKFAWLLPVAVLGLPAGLALFFAAGAAVAGAMWRPGLARLAGLGLAIGVAEIARGTLLTGLPWNTIGYALTANDAMMQWASVFGVYGLSFLAMAVFSAPAAIVEPSPDPHRRPFAALVYFLVMLLALSVGWAWGKLRLEGASVETVPGVRLRVVQPNIPQAEKWKPENASAIFEKHLKISRDGPATAPAGLDEITHLVWPESALPFLLADTSEALAAIADLLPDSTVLLTGQARARDVLNPDGSLKQRHIYNSLFVMDHRAQIVTLYDKLHLVPFGEYLPFQPALEAAGLEQLTRVHGGFTPGVGKRFLKPPGAPGLVPLICYEIIFPHAIAAAGTDPEWMLNLTNDAWFGASPGPYQHFHQARVRAVEQGLPLIRAANTGISAGIDAYGRVVAALPLGVEGALDFLLPAALESRPIVSRCSWIVELVFSAVFLGGWLSAAVRRSCRLN